MSIKMVVTDLDGTLLRNDKTISEETWKSFHMLGEKKIIRVAATGRNLFSLKKVIPPDFPFDFIVFSTGSGIYNWQSHKLLLKNGISKTKTKYAIDILYAENLDFTVHQPIPDNHYFYYHQPNENNAGFNNYREYYKDFSSPINFNKLQINESCQLLTIIDNNIEQFCHLKNLLKDFRIIRTTSPIENHFLWMEIFPPHVNKAYGVDWLCQYLNIKSDSILAIGNDFNDVDLLDFAGHARIVENSHPELKTKYQCVASNDQNGVIEAIHELVI